MSDFECKFKTGVNSDYKPELCGQKFQNLKRFLDHLKLHNSEKNLTPDKLRQLNEN